MKARITIMPQAAILDPAGVATKEALHDVGVTGITSLRIGKFIELEYENLSEQELHGLCDQYLSNPVIEEYHLEILS